MASFTDEIKQAFNALGLANSGEVSGRYRMEARLRAADSASQAPASGQVLASEAPTLAAAPPRVRRQIALGVGATLPAAVLDYAINLCRRLQADLLLLTTDPLGLHRLIAPRRENLAGILCEAEELSSVSRRSLCRVLENHSRVLFAISGTPDDPVRCLVKGKGGLFRGESPVPVVVVGDNDGRPHPRAAKLSDP
ncbi:MAG: hypothetical protein EP309_06180 [Gammaproteobacteria bacterium]|nr:MAG: hypothetical protein EP309_06180 [Gammaproteobacteria bacterium]